MIKDAIILAGGFGTRLLPLTEHTPKPLLPVCGRPFIETLFARLAASGVRRVTLALHHQPQAFRRALPRLRRFGLQVRLKTEAKPLGTGGAIRFAWPDPAKPCLVLNGDALSDFDIAGLQRAHQRSGALATLWALRVPDTGKFGVLECGAQGRIRRFVEKPRPGQTRSKLINAGLYALEPALRQAIPAGRAVSVEREVFPSLLAQGADLRAYAGPGRPYWNDIGTPEAYLRAQFDVAQGKLWKGRGLARRLWSWT